MIGVSRSPSSLAVHEFQPHFFGPSGMFVTKTLRSRKRGRILSVSEYLRCAILDLPSVTIQPGWTLPRLVCPTGQKRLEDIPFKGVLNDDIHLPNRDCNCQGGLTESLKAIDPTLNPSILIDTEGVNPDGIISSIRQFITNGRGGRTFLHGGRYHLGGHASSSSHGSAYGTHHRPFGAMHLHKSGAPNAIFVGGSLLGVFGQFPLGQSNTGRSLVELRGHRQSPDAGTCCASDSSSALLMTVLLLGLDFFFCFAFFPRRYLGIFLIFCMVARKS